MKEKKTSGLGIASMVIGIISLLIACCYGGFLGIVGLILGIIDFTKPESKKGPAIAGIITSALAILISLIVIITGISSSFLSESSELSEEDTELITTEALLSTEETTAEITTTEETTTTTEEATTTTETPEVSEDEFKASCETISYKDLLRNPDDYVNRNIVITVKVSQTGIPGGFLSTDEYIKGYSNDEYDWWMGDIYTLVDRRTTDDTKILEDDIITVYGTFTGLQEFELALTGTKEEYPLIAMKYMDLIEE